VNPEPKLLASVNIILAIGDKEMYLKLSIMFVLLHVSSLIACPVSRMFLSKLPL